MSARSLPRGAKVLCWVALLVIVALVFVLGGGGESDAIAGMSPAVEDAGALADEIDDAGEKPGAGTRGVLLLLAAIALMIALGSPLFVIIGVVATMCFLLFGDGYDDFGACQGLDAESDEVCKFDDVPAKISALTTKNVLLAIPFFVVSGAIMSAGDIANRLVAFARALVGFLPGGLAVATVGGCVFFAAISGSSPVTVIAIGAVMYPALVRAGYNERFSLGLVTSAGSLGIVIPPSIPMLVFAIVAGGATTIDVGELFMSGILPGLFIGMIIALYAMFYAMRDGTTERTKFSGREVWVAFRDGLWAILLPVQILGGIYSGLFTATEAAAVSVIYALVVELFIHRQLGAHQLPKILSEAAVMMGSLLVIMTMAFVLNDFLVAEKIPDRAVALIQSWDLDVVEFLLVVNVLLLIAGALMDSISAIMIIAPLITPIAIRFGIDPIHLGIIFIVNLEIGYLTPPIGLNLFVASSVFGKSLGECIKSVVPYILIMIVGLGVVTYVPSLALGPVNALLRGEPFYEPFPTSEPGGGRAQRADMPVILKPGEGTGEKRVLTSDEINKITSQFVAYCAVAEDIVDLEPTPADPVRLWLDGLPAAGASDPLVLELANKAAAMAGTPEAYATLDAEKQKLAKGSLDEIGCDDLKDLLTTSKPPGPPGSAKPPAPSLDDDEDEDESEG
jgi:C4-dicarboxylate transporter DctM subunit